MELSRHMFVWLDPDACSLINLRQTSPHDREFLARWVSERKPFVARRRLGGDAAGEVSLGLALPPSMGKLRLALTVSPEVIISSVRPPLLADVSSTALSGWQDTILALLAIDRNVRCFGSLAWQYLTGLPYMSATSDLDLIWQVSRADEASRLATAISAAQDKTAVRIDGELVNERGMAVHWREWSSEAEELLVKAGEGNQLLARSELFT